ncbi:MAG: (2Fe-2S)-binding protein [Nitrososphaeria archaeon]
MQKIRFDLNGEEVEAEFEPGETALDVLKERLNVVDVKRGCDEGQCGACTVLLDGKPVLSCLLPAQKLNGRSVRTLSGLMSESRMRALSEEFVKETAFQCGYCTSGFLITIYSFIEDRLRRGDVQEDDEALRKELNDALVNNICRCGAYKEIERAALRSFKLALGEKEDR